MSGSYTASDIKVLEGLEAVRKRPAMYIGDTASYGLHHLVYEVVDNSVDEALAGHCDSIKVILHSDGTCSVGDNGRGIPVDMHGESGKSAAEIVLTVLHAGGKFEHSAYKVSGGLHGVGVSVVNALSEWLDLEIRREGKEWTQRYEYGVATAPLTPTGSTRKTGTIIRFKPDAKIFEETTLSFDVLSNRLRELAFLNRGLKIVIEDERDERSHTFLYKGGIIEFVKHLNQNKTPIHPKVLFFEGKRGDVEVEVALQYNDGYQENVFSFANNINTREGGTHLTGFRAALTSRIAAYAEANGFLKNFKGGLTGDDVREGLCAVVSVRCCGSRSLDTSASITFAPYAKPPAARTSRGFTSTCVRSRQASSSAWTWPRGRPNLSHRRKRRRTSRQCLVQSLASDRRVLASAVAQFAGLRGQREVLGADGSRCRYDRLLRDLPEHERWYTRLHGDDELDIGRIAHRHSETLKPAADGSGWMIVHVAASATGASSVLTRSSKTPRWPPGPAYMRTFAPTYGVPAM